MGSGDTVNLKSNPLSSASINTHIPALQSRGVTVEFDSSGGSSSSGGGGSGSHGACRAGLVVNPNESCTYKDDYTFSVSCFWHGKYYWRGTVYECGEQLQRKGHHKWRALEFCCLEK